MSEAAARRAGGPGPPPLRRHRDVRRGRRRKRGRAPGFCATGVDAPLATGDIGSPLVEPSGAVAGILDAVVGGWLPHGVFLPAELVGTSPPRSWPTAPWFTACSGRRRRTPGAARSDRGRGGVGDRRADRPPRPASTRATASSPWTAGVRSVAELATRLYADPPGPSSAHVRPRRRHLRHHRRPRPRADGTPVRGDPDRAGPGDAPPARAGRSMQLWHRPIPPTREPVPVAARRPDEHARVQRTRLVGDDPGLRPQRGHRGHPRVQRRAAPADPGGAAVPGGRAQRHRSHRHAGHARTAAG